MKKGDDVGKICLVIAYKKHIFRGKFADIFCSGYFQFINDYQARVGNHSDEKINNLPDDMNSLESFHKGR